jgi:hypothetical protein
MAIFLPIDELKIPLIIFYFLLNKGTSRQRFRQLQSVYFRYLELI